MTETRGAYEPTEVWQAHVLLLRQCISESQPAYDERHGKEEGANVCTSYYKY